MKECICKEEFMLDKYDDDGFATGDCMTIEQGSIFEMCDLSFRMLGDLDSIRLENGSQWLEISQETLDRHFELLEEQE